MYDYTAGGPDESDAAAVGAHVPEDVGVPSAPVDAETAPEPRPPLHQGDIDNDQQWVGIAAAGGTALLSLALLGWLAVANKRDHKELELKIEGVDHRLLDYRQAHALVHDAMQRQLLGMQASMQQQIQAGHHQQNVLQSMSPRARRAASAAAVLQGAAMPFAPVVSMSPPIAMPAYGTGYGVAGYPPAYPPPVSYPPAYPPPVSYPPGPPAFPVGYPPGPSSIPPTFQYASPAPVPTMTHGSPTPGVPTAAMTAFAPAKSSVPAHLERAIASASKQAARSATRASDITARFGGARG